MSIPAECMPAVWRELQWFRIPLPVRILKLAGPTQENQSSFQLRQLRKRKAEIPDAPMGRTCIAMQPDSPLIAAAPLNSLQLHPDADCSRTPKPTPQEWTTHPPTRCSRRAEPSAAQTPGPSRSPRAAQQGAPRRALGARCGGLARGPRPRRTPRRTALPTVCTDAA